MLTPKQEAFVRKIVEGCSQADAYRSAYSAKRMSDKTIHEAASRLMKDSKISARVQELQEKVANDSIMTAQKRLEWLTGIIQSAEEETSDKLKACDLMNKMQGEYTQKIEAEVKNELTIKVELTDDED